MTINILGVLYSVHEVSCVSREEMRLGQVDHIRQEILIDSELAEDRKNVVLLHEVIHCILYALGEADEHNDESLVQGLASAIYQITKDNPRLF